MTIRGRTQTTIYLVSPVLVQMWAAGEPGPDADLATVGVGAVPVQMWRGSRGRLLGSQPGVFRRAFSGNA